MRVQLDCCKLSHMDVHSSKTQGKGQQNHEFAEAQLFLHQACLSLLTEPQRAGQLILTHCVSVLLPGSSHFSCKVSLCRFSEPAWSQRAEGRGQELSKPVVIPFEGWKLPEKKRKRLGSGNAWKEGSGEYLAFLYHHGDRGMTVRLPQSRAP